MTPRDAARSILESALAAGDVAPLVRRHLRVDPRHGRVHVLGCGKASGAMAAVAEEVVGDRIVIHAVEVNEKLVAHTVEIGTATTAKHAGKH